MLSLDEIETLTYTATSRRCAGCSNHCMLTLTRFSNGQSHITGNRCEKGIGDEQGRKKAPNMVDFKRARIFDYYEPLKEAEAPRGVIGIPRVLNVYENYPFWSTFFKKLGFSVVLSPWSSRKIYELGMESIPSESECYPAKLSHGHVEWLIAQGIKTIFHPCIFFEHQETENAQNHYNCPIVVSYAENIKNNMESITTENVRYIQPFMAFTSEQSVTHKMIRVCAAEWNIAPSEVKAAVHAAWTEQLAAKEDIRHEGERLIALMKDEGKKGIVLAGRPYHVDPEINHGIPELISSYGLYVFTEDSLPLNPSPVRPVRVVDQWVYHSRLYNAAEFVCYHDDLELIQLNSFGCGLDAVTTDQVSEILEHSNKLYTLLKIDEVNNLGAVRIRIRSLLSAMKIRDAQNIKAKPDVVPYPKNAYTKQMQDQKYTIIAPQMSPIHFEILEPVFAKHGYHIVVLDNDNRSTIDVGLKFVNNDACYPSITAVGQIMDAVLSGKYDTDHMAIIMSQTGGCCRASNYVAFIRRALDKVGYSHIPVISLNANGMETNEGFKISPKLLIDAVHAVVYGDLLMRCLYRVRPYELTKGSANALHAQLRSLCIESLVNPKSKLRYKAVCKQIVKAFDEFPIDEQLKKPKVGVVGEILVKYMPLANNHIVDLLEREGAQAVVPDLIDFFNYSFYNNKFRRENYQTSFKGYAGSMLAIKAIALLRQPAVRALRKSKRFDAPISITEIEELTQPLLSTGNQYGEGWFLAGEMVELITHGTPNIVCIQPFACLPNHVVGKGVIKKLREMHAQANVVAVDYDPGASEVNQLNRIKLMLSVAKENM
jgi:predicted nucleotide-binding protein (sugar kinase/HSP70/actin superfamily)